MGATTYIISTSTARNYPWAADVLKLHQLNHTPTSEGGSNPSPRELRSVLDGLRDYKVEYMVSRNNWQALVEAQTGLPLLRASLLVNVIDFQGDESQPHLICFEKGDQKLNLLIVQRLSRICGPLYLIPDTGDRPWVVVPDSDPADTGPIAGDAGG